MLVTNMVYAEHNAFTNAYSLCLHPPCTRHNTWPNPLVIQQSQKQHLICGTRFTTSLQAMLQCPLLDQWPGGHRCMI